MVQCSWPRTSASLWEHFSSFSGSTRNLCSGGCRRMSASPSKSGLFGSGALIAAIFALPGFDHRLGWSRAWLGAEPTWLEVFSLAMVLGAELAMARVLWINRYAGRTIRVE